MIKFFRKIRQQLLNEGKTVRYLKYAIGEIVLVMIGILLALQVNNWNELRKKNALEIKILNEIKVNLVSTMLSFNRTIETEEIYLKYNFKILDHINNNKPYDESLDEAFGMYFWTVTTPTVSAGYEYLKSTGLELIANDSLRIEISSIFENEIPVISSSNEVWANNLQQSISYSYHVENFVRYFSNLKSGDWLEFSKPNEYSSLMNDLKFKSINTEIISNRKWNINTLEDLTKRIKKVIEDINNEIKILTL